MLKCIKTPVVKKEYVFKCSNKECQAVYTGFKDDLSMSTCDSQFDPRYWILLCEHCKKSTNFYSDHFTKMNEVGILEQGQ
jgi:hypothetical protein